MSTALQRSESRLLFELKKQAEASARLTTLSPETPAFKRCEQSINRRGTLINDLKFRIKQLNELSSRPPQELPTKPAQQSIAARAAVKQRVPGQNVQIDQATLEQMLQQRIDRAAKVVVEKWTKSFLDSMITSLRPDMSNQIEAQQATQQIEH